MNIEKCKNCDSNTERMMSDTVIWYCEEVGEYCSDMKRCPKTLKNYKVHVHVVMEADVYVYAENEDEAGDIVDDNVYPIDYANGTCGFSFRDKIEEIDDVTCDYNYMEIDTVEEMEG